MRYPNFLQRVLKETLNAAWVSTMYSEENPGCVHTTEGIIQKVRNETLLKLMPRGPELDKILTITREANFRHISYLTSCG